jgi:hypothetical protein
LFLFPKVNYEHKQAAAILKIKEQISSVAKLSLKGLPQKEIIFGSNFSSIYDSRGRFLFERMKNRKAVISGSKNQG